MLTPFSGKIPSHIPKELVLSYPLHLGVTTYDNPYETLIPAIHKMPPAFWAPDADTGIAPAWVFRRAKDINRIFADTEHFSSKSAPFSQLIGESWDMLPLEADPPNHRHYRMLLLPFLTPAKISQMDARLRGHARYYAQRFRDNGGCDFVSEFAARFPVAVFLELFGLPIEEIEQFLQWENDLFHEPDINKIGASVREIKSYIMAEVNDRKAAPKDDLISYLTHGKVNNRAATDEEIWGLCFTLYAGGLDTVATSLGWYFRHLATHPKDQEILRSSPEIIPRATEEFLRRYSVTTLSRKCIKPIKIGEASLEPGDKVILPTPLGSNDPEEYEDPYKFDLYRKSRHMAFGSGIHSCVGFHLARREIHIAFEEILAIIPNFTIAQSSRILTGMGSVISQKNLPLVW
ncbi:MAG: cytochrome P450 [Pseudomonadota bacterium]|nr:cytochrome P450 [Pseudomonadota bacterium]